VRDVLRLLAFCGPIAAATTYGFPPYRSTDAETADPWTIEARFGLLRYTRQAGQNEYETPLARVNLGFPHGLELITELAIQPVERRVGDAAIGLKWVPYLKRLSVGVEALALLPVSDAGGGGVEAQALFTARLHPVLLHVNAGGYFDARVTPRERAWEASLLGEVKLGRWHPGLEVAAWQPVPAPVSVLAGVGLIVELGTVVIHAGVHAGLTAAAPDVRVNLWVSFVLPLRARPD
jgi:hypothetical protein